MRLRTIDFGLTSPLRSQAVYHGLAETISEDSDPILSLVSPETPYVCVGMHQEIAREVDEEFCRARGLPVIRRRVGGGAVYLDRDQLFTHFIYPRAKAPEFAANLYPMFIEPVVRTYRELGVEAAYRPINDIHVNGRKIGGTGAASIGEATVMVGSFMFDFDTATMARCLKVPSEKFRDKLHQTLQDYMTTIVKELGERPDREALIARFLAHCADVLGVEPEADAPTEDELAAIARAEEALADPAWTYGKGAGPGGAGVKIAEGTHLSESARKAPGGLLRVRLLARDGAIEDLTVSGDFTCLPHDAMDRLAASLKGARLEGAALLAAIEAGVAQIGMDAPGVSAEDLRDAVMDAAEAGA